MQSVLKDVFELEDAKQFDKAFDAYQRLYDPAKPDFQIWKHYHFFLWTLIEETETEIATLQELRQLRSAVLKAGEEQFTNKAEFNFVAGYTLSIFPFEYEGYLNAVQAAKQMLFKATQLQPDDAIYRMCYLGSDPAVSKISMKKVSFWLHQKCMILFPAKAP